MKLSPEDRAELYNSGKFNYFRTQRATVRENNPDLLFLTKADAQMGNYNPSAFPNLTEKDVEMCSQLFENMKRRRSTLAERLYYWTIQRKGVEVYFFTFTFSNKTLETTTFEYRKDKIRRILKAICLDYVLNVDHGSTTEREHYHGFLVLEEGKYPRKPIKTTGNDGKKVLIWRTEALKEYDMGSYSLQEMKPKNKDIKKVASYIDKVTNHALKLSSGSLSYMSNTEYHKYSALRKQLSPEVYEWSDLEDKVRDLENQIIELTHNEEAPLYLYRANYALKDLPPLIIE